MIDGAYVHSHRDLCYFHAFCATCYVLHARYACYAAFTGDIKVLRYNVFIGDIK